MHRLGNGHEEAGHVRVGDGHRAAALDLLLEDRGRRCPGCRARCRTARPRRRARAARRPRAHDGFGHALGGAHDARSGRRPCRWKSARSAGRRRPTAASTSVRVPRTLFVTASSGVRLHQRHVLVRGGVEDDGRPLGREHRAQAVGVADVGDDRVARCTCGCDSRSRLAMSKMLFSPWPTTTRSRGVGVRDLTAQFGADRSAGAGDQHDLALQIHPGVRAAERSGARRSRSLISTWRSRLTLTPPSRSSNSPGSARAGTPARRHASSTARTTEPDAVGIAMITCWHRAARPRPRGRPAGRATGTP